MSSEAPESKGRKSARTAGEAKRTEYGTPEFSEPTMTGVGELLNFEGSRASLEGFKFKFSWANYG